MQRKRARFAATRTVSFGQPGHGHEALSMNSPQPKLEELRTILMDFSEDLDSLASLLSVDVPSSLNKIRFISEKALHMLCSAKSVSWGDAEPTLERMLGPLVAKGCIPKSVAIHLRTIQTNTSPGSHYQEST